jgi:hypothetical protein
MKSIGEVEPEGRDDDQDQDESVTHGDSVSIGHLAVETQKGTVNRLSSEGQLLFTRFHFAGRPSSGHVHDPVGADAKPVVFAAVERLSGFRVTASAATAATMALMPS